MSKNTYWITDSDGTYAVVDGADERDLWTKVRGWAEADEPGPTDQVCVSHEGAGRGRIPYAALQGEWSGLGWTAAAPPEPVNLAIPPERRAQVKPAAEPAAAEPAKSSAKPTPATSGDKKE